MVVMVHGKTTMKGAYVQADLRAKFMGMQCGDRAQEEPTWITHRIQGTFGGVTKASTLRIH